MASAAATSKEGTPPQCCLHLAFTAHGLDFLGLPPATLRTFLDEFQQGMASRQNVLRDEPASNWELCKSGREPDAALLIYAKDETALRKRIVAELARMPEGATHERQDTELHQPTREPFGFRDGISQPALQGYGNPRLDNPTSPLGEFILGYANAYGILPFSPFVAAETDLFNVLPEVPHDPSARDFGKHGTYLVIRKLEQDVAAFERAMSEHAQRFGVAPDSLAEKLVGRTKAGTLLPNCPAGAHVRRANPRGTLEATLSRPMQRVAHHRIIRRGRVWNTDGRQGILFMAINSNIGRQFEFIQQNWLNSESFAGLQNSSDPISGINDGAGEIVLSHVPRTEMTSLPRFVKHIGGGYFFLPSIAALKYLGALKPLGLAVESKPEGEDSATELLCADVRATMRRAPDGSRLRGAHAKQHACVEASFSVTPDLPVHLRVGLFYPGAKYRALLRFSNASEKLQSDAKPDIRGCAIKLLNVVGDKLLRDDVDNGCHDFVLVNSDRFVVADVESFHLFFRALSRGPLASLLYAATHVATAWRVFQLRSKIASVLDASYFSVGPFQFGPGRAARYRLRACTLSENKCASVAAEPDFLAQELKARLASSAAWFEFQVQLQLIPRRPEQRAEQKKEGGGSEGAGAGSSAQPAPSKAAVKA